MPGATGSPSRWDATGLAHMAGCPARMRVQLQGINVSSLSLSLRGPSVHRGTGRPAAGTGSPSVGTESPPVGTGSPAAGAASYAAGTESQAAAAMSKREARRMLQVRGVPWEKSFLS
eukprot:361363-Chlamydomonas_euryale.AAC.4